MYVFIDCCRYPTTSLSSFSSLSSSSSSSCRYLGFSWASGVVTIDGKPYPNGRNEESSSESISAYEVSHWCFILFCVWLYRTICKSTCWEIFKMCQRAMLVSSFMKCIYQADASCNHLVRGILFLMMKDSKQKFILDIFVSMTAAMQHIAVHNTAQSHYNNSK